MKENSGRNIEKHRKLLELRIKYLEQIIPTLSEGFQKTRLIEQKKHLEFNLSMITLTDETYDILQQIVKLDDEYKELLERQNNGEFVSDLIKQNRYLVQLFHEQDKRNCVEFRLLKKTEEKRRSEKRIQDEKEASKWLAAHPDIARTIPKSRKEQRKEKKVKRSERSFRKWKTEL